ncbi:MAG: NADPH-dependent 7-cyano-7-deazaguanine reductase QueF [Candidatus Eisenbacteria bacterium]|uniref:NADPH-dependent 7-cyano-7-deazaguanine reductase n=1 Tax=Eiseniibacteriota bacterium TaxID=2212470 RepID=A0A849SEG6_UNCEI|nr:NADPH-dependent 7-cyano-7-deazaguanine reductase QueF [Candidatus Eisenbacteria bacterium]
MPSRPSKQLDSFPNPNPERDYVVRHECPEFTAICPVTGQPDFGCIAVHYVPDRRCVELKSLKLYLWSFRDEGHFFEAVTNRILDDLVRATRPRRMTVVGRFNVRGGISSTAVASYDASRDALPAEPRAARRGVALAVTRLGAPARRKGGRR